ncbi:hypothetical protein HMI55_006224 [Coelomomyces lativittatus]|nr:hypothetical protein HMI55_006224 [Coelomomyces lativittatus]
MRRTGKSPISAERNPEYQISTCTFLQETLSTYPCAKKDIQEILNACKLLMKSELEAVFQSSSKLYLSCIEYGLDHDILLQIVKSAISEGGFTQPTPSRVWCGKVLCAAAPHFTSEEIETIFLEKVLVLCQDTDQEVRCCMGKHIGNIVKVIRPPIVLEKVMSEFIELLKDEERSVRIASLDGLGDVLDSLSEATLSEFIIPTLFLILLDPCLKKGLSRHIGRFFWYCKVLEKKVRRARDTFSQFSSTIHPSSM